MPCKPVLSILLRLFALFNVRECVMYFNRHFDMCRVRMVRFMLVQGRTETVGQLAANAVAFLSYPWVAPVAPEKAHGDDGRWRTMKHDEDGSLNDKGIIISFDSFRSSQSVCRSKVANRDARGKHRRKARYFRRGIGFDARKHGLVVEMVCADACDSNVLPLVGRSPTRFPATGAGQCFQPKKWGQKVENSWSVPGGYRDLKHRLTV